MFIIAKQIALHMSHCREQKDVMHTKFTYVFVLDRNFEILILWIQEEIVQSQLLKSAVPISSNLAVTWSDNYTLKNAWLVSSSL